MGWILDRVCAVTSATLEDQDDEDRQISTESLSLMIVSNYMWLSGSTHVGLTDLLHNSTDLLPCLTSVAIVFKKEKYKPISGIDDTPVDHATPNCVG